MSYSVVIVEDENHQQEMLSSLLKENFAEYKIIGVAASIESGKQMLTALKPDLVFLDVLLPPYTSFDLLNTFDAIPFEIIFTTSYEEHAVKAFQLSAVDYLVKPFSLEQLCTSLKKFEQKKLSKDSVNHLKILIDNIRTVPKEAKVALPTFKGYILIPVKDIIRCQSDNTYTTFFTKDKRSIIVSKTLKDCEHMLADHGFFRVHNSHLINVEYISEYLKGEGGTVKMMDGSQLDVSRRRKDEFLQLLKRI